MAEKKDESASFFFMTWWRRDPIHARDKKRPSRAMVMTAPRRKDG
jgi:hypothetical protein